MQCSPAELLKVFTSIPPRGDDFFWYQTKDNILVIFNVGCFQLSTNYQLQLVHPRCWLSTLNLGTNVWNLAAFSRSCWAMRTLSRVSWLISPVLYLVPTWAMFLVDGILKFSVSTCFPVSYMFWMGEIIPMYLKSELFTNGFYICQVRVKSGHIFFLFRKFFVKVPFAAWENHVPLPKLSPFSCCWSAATSKWKFPHLREIRTARAVMQ